MPVLLIDESLGHAVSADGERVDQLHSEPRGRIGAEHAQPLLLVWSVPRDSSVNGDNDRGEGTVASPRGDAETTRSFFARGNRRRLTLTISIEDGRHSSGGCPRNPRCHLHEPRRAPRITERCSTKLLSCTRDWMRVSRCQTASSCTRRASLSGKNAAKCDGTNDQTAWGGRARDRSQVAEQRPAGGRGPCPKPRRIPATSLSPLDTRGALTKQENSALAPRLAASQRLRETRSVGSLSPRSLRTRRRSRRPCFLPSPPGGGAAAVGAARPPPRRAARRRGRAFWYIDARDAVRFLLELLERRPSPARRPASRSPRGPP